MENIPHIKYLIMKIAGILLGLALTVFTSNPNLQKISTHLTNVEYPTDCMKEKCATQYDACIKDKKCMKIIDKCEKTCKSYESCW